MTVGAYAYDKPGSYFGNQKWEFQMVVLAKDSKVLSGINWGFVCKGKEGDVNGKNDQRALEALPVTSIKDYKEFLAAVAMWDKQANSPVKNHPNQQPLGPFAIPPYGK